MKVCPKCHTENPVAANYCRHCRYEFPEATKGGGSLSPMIHSFSISEKNYTIGSVIVIGWTIENATTVKLNGQDVTAYKSLDYKVEKAESLVLRAENDYDVVVRTIPISPKPLPRIKTFSASQYAVQAGQDVKLKWDVSNAKRMDLVSSAETVDVTRKTYCKVYPTKTETYILKCYAEDESIVVEQELAIRVTAPVVINYFKADKDVVIEADKVTLSWNIDNAETATLFPLMKDVIGMTKYEVSPSRTTEYRLIVKNSISQCEQIVSVGVRQLPKIDADFATSFAQINIPPCNIEMSFLPNSMRESGIDEWMTNSPKMEIEHKVWKEMIKRKFKEILKAVRFCDNE